MSLYTPTGHRRGAPKIGDVRVDNANAAYGRARRANNPDAVREYQREYQREYRKNPENLARIQANQRDGQKRKKARDADPDFDRVMAAAEKAAEKTKVRVRRGYITPV